MATKGQTAVGSTAWVAAEKENVMQLLDQEKEEVIYPAQHEMDWLNEHMAEIFSRNQFNVTDVFKTPGKLRGKTPRTNRKRNAQEARIPLSDVFSTNLPLAISPGKFNIPGTQNVQFGIIQGDEDTSTECKPVPPLSKSHTDSGYHGSSQDELDTIDPSAHTSALRPFTQITPTHETEREGTAIGTQGVLSAEGRTTEGSFHSANEENSARLSLIMEHEPKQSPKPAEVHTNDATKDKDNECADDNDHDSREMNEMNKRSTIFEHEFDDIGSPSDGSTPDRPIVRKSSLTFASLPAREPLKTSLGGRLSRTSQVEQGRAAVPSRSSYLARQTVGPRMTQMQPGKLTEDNEQPMDDVEDGQDPEDDQCDEETKATKLHSKSSTQRLHEKIDMLGKVQPPRLSKSIPSAAILAASHTKQPEAVPVVQKPLITSVLGTGSVVDDDDDWIKPIKSPQPLEAAILTENTTADMMDSMANDDTEDEDGFDIRAPELIAHEERMKTPVRQSPRTEKAPHVLMHTKSASTATLASPGKATMAPTAAQMKIVSVSNPPHSKNTPHSSPKRLLDAPLTASKSRLQSIMKTAKGLFTSSAGVSAAAKMEALSPNALRIAANNMPGLYPNLNSLLEDKPLPASPPKEIRRTRSSLEREKRKEKEAKALQKQEGQLERAREVEKQKASQHKEAQEKARAPKADQVSQPSRVSPRRLAEEQRATERVVDAVEIQPTTTSSQQSKLSRPTRPIREAASNTKPQPVAIRVGTLSQRLPLSNAALASTLPEVLPAPALKTAAVTKKTSIASLQSSTSGPTFKSSVSGPVAKPKALLAAQRKREHDEREAQRKLDHKRENEQKRAAQQEEARRQEQRHRAEVEKKEHERVAAEQAKRAAHQQALEKKRIDNERRLEQQRFERTANETSLASSRPASRLGSTQPLGRSVMNNPIPPNPAKPAKRPLEEDAGPGRQQAPKFGAASQQADSKRRKTEDESISEPVARPTMAGAPIRQSNMVKKPSMFAHPSYVPAPPPTSQSNLAQTQSQPFPYPSNIHQIAHTSAMAKYANGAKIPFADAPNPASQTSKTPASAYHPKTIQPTKSSPHYPNGEAINLPEIPTDSEDEDSGDEGNAFPVPDWATPGHLTNQLIQQEGVDVDAVFGPIAPLKMEDIFSKGNKDRLKRMRDRTSSANWAVSGDGLTLEEVRIDKEQRERMRLEGGWRYGS